MTFATNDSGAVTVDWVVLTAGLVGLGLATMSVVSSGVQDLSQDTATEMGETLIYTSFAQHEYSALYEAIERRDRDYKFIFFTPDGAFTQFEDLSAFIDDDDDTLLQKISTMSPFGEQSTTLADAYATIPSGATAQEIATAVSIYGTVTEAVVLEGANRDYGGDLDAYVAGEFSQYAVTMEQLAAMKAEADKRGLTY